MCDWRTILARASRDGKDLFVAAEADAQGFLPAELFVHNRWIVDLVQKTSR